VPREKAAAGSPPGRWMVLWQAHPQPLETDWRLFTTLVRFDAIYFGHFKCNLRWLVDHPNLFDHRVGSPLIMCHARGIESGSAAGVVFTERSPNCHRMLVHVAARHNVAAI
jgi:hypothetical protein